MFPPNESLWCTVNKLSASAQCTHSVGSLRPTMTTSAHIHRTKCIVSLPSCCHLSTQAQHRLASPLPAPQSRTVAHMCARLTFMSRLFSNAAPMFIPSLAEASYGARCLRGPRQSPPAIVRVYWRDAHYAKCYTHSLKRSNKQDC